MKVQWKKIGAMCAVAFMTLALAAADMPRSEWLSKVGDCANNAATMQDTVSKVSAADQAAVVAEVNAAIAKMPGSNEQRAAAFVKANIAALTAAMLQNKEKKAGSAVLAEIYATVPPEYLTVVSEQLAKTVLKRGGLSKEVFITISTNLLHTVTERCEKAANGGVREAFAAVTFLKALGEPASKDVISTMLSQMGDAKTRDTAKGEWIGPALGIDGNTQSYDPMLGAAGAGDEPDHTVVESLLAAGAAGTGNGGSAPANNVGTTSTDPANTAKNDAGKVVGADGQKADAAAATAGAADAKTDATAGAGAAKTDATAAGANTGSGEAQHPVVVTPTGAGDVSVILLADLAAMGSGMQTTGGTAVDQIPGVAPSDISMDRVPRGYMGNGDGVGGNKDGKNDENPYYRRNRGDNGEEPSGPTPTPPTPYNGQNLKAW